MCKTTELLGQLTDEERASLRTLSGPARRKIPFDHAAKFLSLGLAELHCGYQELTISGKRAVTMLRH